MFSKLFEGLALIVGMCILMHALFSSDAGNRAETPSEAPDRSWPPGKGRAAYLLFGSTLLVYGLAEVVLRSVR